MLNFQIRQAHVFDGFVEILAVEIRVLACEFGASSQTMECKPRFRSSGI